MGATLPKEVRLQYEAEAWSLRQKFWSQDRIAEKLGISQPAVSVMLARVERRMLARMEKRIGQTKARQTAQLETIASEAFDAWLHSKTPQLVDKVTTESGDDDAGDDDEGAIGGPGLVTRVHETKTHHCDSSLLAQARGALADIRAIWGLDAAKKTEVSGTMKMYDVANTPDEL